MDNKARILEALARGAALLAGAVVLILYAVFVARNPYSGSELAQNSIFLMTLVAALAGVEIWAVWNRLPLVVLIAFFFSFIPVGMFMLGTKSVFQIVGMAHLSYLLIALLSWLDRREHRRTNQKAAAEAAATHSESR